MKPRNLVFRVCFVIAYATVMTLIASMTEDKLAIVLAMVTSWLAATSWLSWHLLAE